LVCQSCSNQLQVRRREDVSGRRLAVDVRR
jgi:hypothetical protein